MAAPRQGLPVRLERAPHPGAAFALSNASKRARTRSIGSRSRGSLFIGSRSRGPLFIFRSPPAVAPQSGKAPDRVDAPTRRAWERDGSGFVTTHQQAARRGQLTNAATCRLVRYR